MPVAVVAFLAILFIAGIVLMWEARTGRFTAASHQQEAWRAVLFFLATVAGSALLIRSMGGTVLLALVFIPVTVLSLIRFVALARRRFAGAASFFALALVLWAGLWLGLYAVPYPLDEGFFMEHIFHLDSGPGSRSIDPAAGRPVRV
ncbi:MAG: hypothetical protein AAGI91_10705 [Bacteroidota bacterium]